MNVPGLMVFLHILKKHRWWVVSVTLVAMLSSAALVRYVITPQYAATATLLVDQPLTNPQFFYDTVMANQALVTTYSAIIQSRASEQAVIRQLHLPFSTKQLAKMVSVSSPNQSQLIDIRVTTPGQATSAAIANRLAESFQKRVLQWMSVRNVQIINPAEVDTHPVPVRPNKPLTVGAATLIGLAAGIGVALLRESLDIRLTSEEEMAAALGVPVLGVVVDWRKLARMHGKREKTPSLPSSPTSPSASP